MTTPLQKNLSVRTSSIHRYFPYLDAEAVRTVQSAFRARFYDNKDDADYSEFWNEPALSQTFKDLDKTSNAITKALEEGELNGYFTAAQKLLPAEIVNEISIDYNGLIFKGKLKSEAHFYALIDAVEISDSTKQNNGCNSRTLSLPLRAVRSPGNQRYA